MAFAWLVVGYVLKGRAEPARTIKDSIAGLYIYIYIYDCTAESHGPTISHLLDAIPNSCSHPTLTMIANRKQYTSKGCLMCIRRRVKASRSAGREDCGSNAYPVRSDKTSLQAMHTRKGEESLPRIPWSTRDRLSTHIRPWQSLSSNHSFDARSRRPALHRKLHVPLNRTC